MNYYTEINKAIEVGETRDVVILVKGALAELYPPESIFSKGLLQGIENVAQKFYNTELLVPEVILSSRALQAGLKVIAPYLKTKRKKKALKVLIGTVAGDLHDIGKNLIKALITMLNIDVVDLGIDISPEQFVQGIQREKPDILMMSALLTTTISEFKSVIDAIEAAGLRKDLLIFVGGAPVTEVYAQEVGADYYAEDLSALRNILEKF